MGALSKIRKLGFTVIFHDDALYVDPGSKLTDDLRCFIKKWKAEIISSLKDEANQTSVVLQPRRVVVRYRLKDCHGPNSGSGIVIGDNLDEIVKDLNQRYGTRLLSAVPWQVH